MPGFSDAVRCAAGMGKRLCARSGTNRSETRTLIGQSENSANVEMRAYGTLISSPLAKKRGISYDDGTHYSCTALVVKWIS
jgi:hypothetical protein